MKRILLGAVAAAFITSSCIGGATKSSATEENCSESTTKSEDCCGGCNSTASDNIVEVLSFHGAQRCITCKAIETLTREVVEQDFAEQVKSGRLKLTVIDISTKDGEEIADKYEVASSSLYVNKWHDGKESRNNMTQLGFTKAKNFPEEFKAELKIKIADLLK